MAGYINFNKRCWSLYLVLNHPLAPRAGVELAAAAHASINSAPLFAELDILSWDKAAAAVLSYTALQPIYVISPKS